MFEQKSLLTACRLYATIKAKGRIGSSGKEEHEQKKSRRV